MVYSKIKKILFILLCLFIILFPFWCVRGLCAELEEIEYSIANGIIITSNSNVFTTSTSSSVVGYVELEKGYLYHFHNNANSARHIAVSNDVPSLNGTYTYLGVIDGFGDYTYRSDENNTYIYFDFVSNSVGTTFDITREKITGMNSTVVELANFVSPSAFWNIFDISINYIVIVVLVSFGLFIIFRLIKKVSKRKEGF